MIVVAAVIERNGSYLVTRRPPGAHLGGMWEFPGGKVDGAESHAEALGRELREELGVGADVQDLVFSVTHAYTDRTVVLHFYRCRLMGIPRPLLGQEMRWVPRAELASLGFPPADEQLITQLSESDVR